MLRRKEGERGVGARQRRKREEKRGGREAGREGKPEEFQGPQADKYC
jgi:hypothetical protein